MYNNRSIYKSDQALSHAYFPPPFYKSDPALSYAYPESVLSYSPERKMFEQAQLIMEVWGLHQLIPVFMQHNLVSFDEFPRISVRFLQSLRIPEHLGAQFLERVSETMSCLDVLSSMGLRSLWGKLISQGVWSIEQFPHLTRADMHKWNIPPETIELFFFKIRQPQFRTLISPSVSESEETSEAEEKIRMKSNEVVDLMNFLNTTRKGVTLKKYPSTNKMFSRSGMRYFSIQTLQKKQLGDAILSWRKVSNDPKVKRQSLKTVKIWDIVAVRPGLTKIVSGANHKQCFHIELANKTLELEASSTKDQSFWLRNLRLLLKYAEERVKYRTKQCKKRQNSTSTETSESVSTDESTD